MDPSPGRMDLDGLDLQQVPVLSLDQIRSIRASNDYVERPVALDHASQSGFFYAHDNHYPITHGHLHQGYPSHAPLPRSQSQQQHAHLAHLSRSSTASSAMSRTSAASDQRLLAGLTPSHSGLVSVVRSQPKGELKPEVSLGKGLAKGEDLGLHLFICERCGRCKCQECCAPRSLPSCWACGQRCLCSAESAVEYSTCLCCVKGLFYHCSAQDDEDNCADRPCACAPAHACARWGTMGCLALCLPCLCCYPPARLCLCMCQGAHDRATRPGCRCSNTNTVCRKISASNPGNAPFRSKSLEKPV
ncbi:protein sprouty homolog 3 [Esox lucius]|uniref:Sprouty RTK signaling antagonist 3 n=1 Tax=Esox lucius TaxID=8010 RepID=A0AAY5KG75_ESOLU|nr:protein sprouty homolog 3 [Esox lucius]